MTKPFSLQPAGFLGAALTLSLCAHSLTITARAGGYDVTKTCKFTTGTHPPKVSTYYFLHAWVEDVFADGTSCPDQTNKPNVQPANFNPQGKEQLNMDKLSNIVTSNGVVTNVVLNSGFDGKSTNAVTLARSNVVLTAGSAKQIKDSVAAKRCPSKADAAITIDLKWTNAGNTNVFIATNNAQGSVTLLEATRDHRAYSFATAITLVQYTNLGNGDISIAPFVLNDPSTNKPQKVFTSDPVQFTVRDRVTGAVTNGTLFNYIMATTASGSGGFSWTNDHVQIAARDMDFSLDLPGQFTTLAGHLNLQVRNGLVALSDATGIYAGMLPTVGTAVPLDLPLSSELDFEFDLSGITTNGTDVFVYVACAGEVYEEYNAGPIPLALALVNSSPQLSWPLSARAWQLQQATNLGPAAVWSNVTDPPPLLSNDLFTVTLPADGTQSFFRLRMLGPFCTVSINQQPQDVTAPQGSLVTFGVEASGSPSLLSYQWQQKAVGGDFEDIPSANGPSYSRVMFSPDNGSQFRCLVANDCEAQLSQPATLTVF